ncbi:MAG: ABC transporter ATP-binding protein [Deltaproteobacteria bacterium]|nr:ABC transporter ATP-binding protein [Deltaproteobacteria bacterium]
MTLRPSYPYPIGETGSPEAAALTGQPLALTGATMVVPTLEEAEEAIGPELRPGQGNVLSVKALSVDLLERSDRLTVVREASLEIGPREIVGLIGESGGGKSVFWRSLFGLLRGANWRVAGEAFLMGKPLNFTDEEASRKSRGREVGIVPQDPMGSFDPVRTIWNHFLETAQAHVDIPAQEIRAMAEDSLAKLYVDNPGRILDSYPFQCSGGTLQRAMVAISAMLGPALLIADEPTTSVDVTVRLEVLSLLKSLRERIGTSLLLISHDLKAVMSVADELNVMYGGYIVERIKTGDLVAGKAQHPYAKKLIKARPRFSRERLESIPGAPPSLRERQGERCPFLPRCDQSRPSCSDYAMEAFRVGQGHFVRCLLAKGEA